MGLASGTYGRWEQAGKKLVVTVSRFADGEAAAPFELTEALWCENHHALPDPGNMGEQSWTRMTRYGRLRSVYHTMSRASESGVKHLSRSEMVLFQWVCAVLDEMEVEESRESIMAQMKVVQTVAAKG